MASRYYDQTYPSWCLEAVPRRSKKCLSFLTFRFAALICQMTCIICFTWAYTDHEKGVAYIDGLGSTWSSINLGTVRVTWLNIFVDSSLLTQRLKIVYIRIPLVCCVPHIRFLQLQSPSRCGHYLRPPSLPIADYYGFVLLKWVCWVSNGWLFRGRWGSKKTLRRRMLLPGDDALGAVSWALFMIQGLYELSSLVDIVLQDL